MGKSITSDRPIRYNFSLWPLKINKHLQWMDGWVAEWLKMVLLNKLVKVKWPYKWCKYASNKDRDGQLFDERES